MHTSLFILTILCMLAGAAYTVVQLMRGTPHGMFSGIALTLISIITMSLTTGQGRPVKPTLLKKDYIYDVLATTEKYAIVRLHTGDTDPILIELKQPERIKAGNSYELLKTDKFPDKVVWNNLFPNSEVIQKK